MASNVVSIAVQANSDQLTKAFDKGATAGERFKGKMQLVANAVVAALAFKAAQAITDFVGDSIQAFSDLNESLNAVEVTFGKNADGIKRLGEEAASNLGLSNAEFNSFAVQMSAFAEEIAGDGGDVVGVVDQLSTRVSDFASVMNLEVADAATKFQSGLAGETEPLRKFGIDVSAAKVEAFALSEGLIEAGDTMSESVKIQARFGTIMKQTSEVQGDFANTATDYANAQRIANAEMENAEARAGEALVPFAQLTTQLKTLGAEAIGIFSSQILALTGQMENVDSAIQQFEIHMGMSADSAESALTIVKEYGGSFDELIPRLDLSREELIKLRDADEEWLLSMGFTEEQVKDLADATGVELASQLTTAEQAARDAFAANAEYEGGLEEVEEQVEDTTTALERHVEIMQESHDQLREQIDPLFALKDAQRDVEDAQLAVNEAIEKHGEGSPEHLEALEGQTDAYLDLEQAEIDVREAGELTREQFVNQQTALGHTREEAELLADDFESLENFDFKPKIITLSAQMSAADRALFGSAGVPGLQHGGIATGPMLTAIGEGGDDEAVIPLNGRGIKILGAALKEAMGGNGGGAGVHVTVNALDPQSAANAVVQALQTYQRNQGAIPIQTR